MAHKKTALQPRPRCPECCGWVYAYFLVVCFCLPRRISSKGIYYYYYQASAAQEDALKELAHAAQVQHAGTRDIMMLVSLLCLAVGLGYLCKKALRLKAISVLLALAAYLEEPLEEEPWHVVKEIETDEQTRRDVVAERRSQNLQSLRRGHDIETQSQVTYRRDLSQPRFQPLPASLQGAWSR